METIGFDRLHRYDFTLSGINAMPQNRQDGEVYTFLTAARPEHGLMYFIRCGGLYQFEDGHTLNVVPGDLVYLPKHARYKIRFHSATPERPTCQLVNFQLTDKDGAPVEIESEVTPLRFLAPHSYADAMAELLALFYAGSYQPAEMKASLYHFLVSLSNDKRRRELMSKEYRAIAKGILLLERNEGPDLPVKELATLCSVSESCFRKLFKAYAGISPSQYQLKRRIRRAKQLLHSSTHTIGEVAEAVGIADVSYFCRLFKQKVGMSPSEYAARHRFTRV